MSRSVVARCNVCSTPADTFTTFCCPGCGTDVRSTGLGRPPNRGYRRAQAIWTFVCLVLIAALYLLADNVSGWRVTRSANGDRSDGPVAKFIAVASATAFSREALPDEMSLSVLGRTGKAIRLDHTYGNKHVVIRQPGQPDKRQQGVPDREMIGRLVSMLGVEPDVEMRRWNRQVDDLAIAVSSLREPSSKRPDLKTFNSFGFGGPGQSLIAARWGWMRPWILGGGVALWSLGLLVFIRLRARAAFKDHPPRSEEPVVLDDPSPPPQGSEGRCGRCGYSVLGLQSQTCSECGSDVRVVGISTPLIPANGQRRSARVRWALYAMVVTATLLTTFWDELQYSSSRTSWSLVPMDQTHHLTLTLEQSGYGNFLSRETTRLYFSKLNLASSLPVQSPTNPPALQSVGATWHTADGSYRGPLTAQVVASAMAANGIDITDPRILNDAADLAQALPNVSRSIRNSMDMGFIGYHANGASGGGSSRSEVSPARLALLMVCLALFFLGDRWIARKHGN